ERARIKARLTSKGEQALTFHFNRAGEAFVVYHNESVGSVYEQINPSHDNLRPLNSMHRPFAQTTRIAEPIGNKSMQSIRGRHQIGRRELRRAPTLEYCFGTCEPHLIRMRWIVG